MLAVGLLCVGLGCGDDTTPDGGNGGGGGVSDGGKGGAGGEGGTGAQGAAGGQGGTGAGGESTGGGGSGGGTELAGEPGTDFVSAGLQATSPSYRMNFTLGQSTQNQGTSRSPNYRMQGGLQGTNGSLSQ